MGKTWQAVIVLLGVWAVVQPFSNTRVEAKLDPFFYLTTCPQVYPIVAEEVYNAIQNETRAAAFLLRLHFHDCFAQGCDASITLDSTAKIPSEQLATPNVNSIPPRVYTLIETIKSALEDTCPGIVSCADIITLGSFFSVILSGGPLWLAPLGRRDSFEAHNFTASNPLPSPFQTVPELQAIFAAQNLTKQDLVALSGAHTIGNARCVSFSKRLYNFASNPSGPDPTLNSTLRAPLEKLCPNGGDGSVTTFLDVQTPTVFDNVYYQNLLQDKGLLVTDEELYTGDKDTQAFVETYASDQDAFFADFVTGMTKMGNANVLTGTEGEVRLNCSVRNANNWASSFVHQMTNSQRTSESTVGNYKTLKRTESAPEFLKQVLKLVAEKIEREPLAEKSEKPEEFERLVEESERLVEETVTWGHTSM